MIKSLFSFIIVCTCVAASAQIKTNLENISHKLSSFRNYSSICEYTFSMPFGDTLMFESLIVLHKLPKNNICEFNYNFEISESYRGELFGDFSMYFDSTVYNSYKGVVEKTSYSESPSQFMDLKLDMGVAPAIQRRHVLYYITPYQLSEIIENFIADTTLLISQEPDTIINRDTCLRFLVKSGNTRPEFKSATPSKEVNKQITELCFNSSSLYPVYYKKDTRTKMINSLEIAFFKDTKTNFSLKENYFSEENLLPRGWKNPEVIKENENSTTLLGEKAPKWNLPVLGKNEYYSSDSIQEKYALLEFTATWCAHCWEAAKMMNRLEDQFKNYENIELLSIYSSNQDDKESIERFVEKLNIKSTILYSASSVGEKYCVKGYPQFFIISPSGEVINYFRGYGPSVEKNIIDVFHKFTE